MGRSEESGRGSGGGCSPRAPLPLPPPIQPCSGFLGNGKSVIRPIAFKPLSLPLCGSGRLSAGGGGERYGSTPALALNARPPSHMTLYGSSSDVRERWCGSPLSPAHAHAHAQPASLCALPATPHRRQHSAILTKSSSVMSGCSGGGGGESKEPAPAPSPADSGVAEMEREQHEYGPPERVRAEVRVRAPRGLALQGAGGGGSGAGGAGGCGAGAGTGACASAYARRDEELSRVRRERALLRARLEDAEWSVCRRAGEIALLKAQLRDKQSEQTSKDHEFLSLKADCRQLREALDGKEKEMMRLRADACERDGALERLRREGERLAAELLAAGAELARAREGGHSEVEKLKVELHELRQELSDVSLSGYEGVGCGRRGQCAHSEYHWSADSAEDKEVQRLNGEAPDACACERLRAELRARDDQFAAERREWAAEKDKVLRYQQQLQLNYVHMVKRSRALEDELHALRLQLRLPDTGMQERHAKTIQL